MDVDSLELEAHESLDGPTGINVGALDPKPNDTPRPALPDSMLPFGKFRKRLIITALLASVVLILILGGTFIYKRSRNVMPQYQGALDIEEQTVEPQKNVASTKAPIKQPTTPTLQVNSNLSVGGDFRLVNGDGSVLVVKAGAGGAGGTTTLLLPNGSGGTLCVSNNNCNYVTPGQLSDGLAKLEGRPASIVNGINGEVVIQGTTNRVTVTSNSSGVITLGGPQDLAQLSSPTFAGLLLNGDLTASGVAALASINAGDVSISGTLSTAGLATLASVAAGNTSVTGNLGVNGTTTLAGTTASSLGVTGNTVLDGLLTLTSLDCTAFQSGGKLTTDINGQLVCDDDNTGLGAGSFILNQTAQQTDANFNIQAASGTVAAKIQGATGQNIIEFKNSTGTTVAFVGLGGGLYAPTLNNTTDVNNATISPSNTGTTITRNIADANNVLTLQNVNAGSTGNALVVKDSGGSVVSGLGRSGGLFVALSQGFAGTAASFGTGAATNVGVAIRGAAGQTADLLQLQASGGAVQSTFNAAGYLGIGTGTPTAALDVRGGTSQTGTGTLSTSGTNSVTGSGTSFTTQLKTGDTITAAGQTMVVTGVTNDTALTTYGSFSPSLSGASFTYAQSVQHITSSGDQTGLVIRTAAGQTAGWPLLVESSTGAMKAYINKDGIIYGARDVLSGNGSFHTPAGAFNTGAVTLSSGNSSAGGSGDVMIDNGTATTTTGTINIGTTNASGVRIGRSGITTEIQGDTKVTLNGTAGTTQVCSNGSGVLAVCDPSILAPTAGNFIQNQSASAQTANFWVQSNAAGTVGAVIQGAAGQTANLMEFRDSTGAVQATIRPSGSISTTTSLLAGTLTPFSPGSPLQIVAYQTGVPTGIIRGVASQTADLFQLQNSSGTVLTTVDANGNVGIGTATPGASLQVAYPGSAPGNSGNLYVGGTGSCTGTNPCDLSFDGGSDSSFFLNNIGSAGGSTAITYRGARLLTVTNSGNVGINAGTTPANRLAVNTATTADSLAQVFIATAADTNRGLVIQANSATQTADLLQFQNSAGARLAYVRNGGQVYAPSVNNITTSDNARVELNATGTAINRNVADANAVLTVQNLNASSTGDTFSVLASGGSKMFAVNSAGEVLLDPTGVKTVKVGNGTAIGNTQISINTSNAAWTGMGIRGTAGQTGDLLQFQDSAGSVLSTFNAAGQLGIGTSSPQVQLQVRQAAAVSSGAVTMTGTTGNNTFTTSASVTLNKGDYVVPTTSTSQAATIAASATGTSFTIVGTGFGSNITGETFTIYRNITDITDSSGVSKFRVLGNGNVSIGDYLAGGTGTSLKLAVGGSASFNGNIFANSLSERQSAINGQISFSSSTGINVTRNIADANAVLTLQNLNGSSTGDTLTIKDNMGIIKAGFSSYGALYLGSANNPTNARLYVTQATPASIVQVNRAAVGQTGDLLQFQDSTGTVQSTFTASGALGIGTGNPSASLDIQSSNPALTGTGTVSGTAGTGTVTGIGTSFTTELHVGDRLFIDGFTYNIDKISSDTSLVVQGANLASTFSSISFTYRQSAQRITTNANESGLVLQTNGASSYALMVYDTNGGGNKAYIGSGGQIYGAGGITSGGTFQTFDGKGTTNNVILRSGNSTTSGDTGSVTIASGNATSGNSGNITIDAGTASGTSGAISIGTTNASSVSLGKVGSTTTVNGLLGVGTSTPQATFDIRGNGTALTGTGTISSSGTSVTGVGTSFTTELHIGDTITAGGQTRTVGQILNNTSLVTGNNNAFSPALSAGTSFTYTQPAQKVIAGSSAQTALVLQGASGQLGDYFNFIDASGNNVFRVQNDGTVVSGGGLITSTGVVRTGSNGGSGSNSAGITLQSGATTNGGISGAVTVTSGASSGTTSGSGNTIITTGTATGSGNTAGSITVDTGVASSGATGGTISIGTANASSIVIGNNSIPLQLSASSISASSIALSGGTNTVLSKVYTTGTGGVNQYDSVALVDDGGTARVVDTTIARDPRVIGVVTNPGLSTAGNAVSIAYVGTVTVNVDNAAVAIGDQLVTSTTSGKATVDNTATTGIIGTAMTTKAGGSAGTVRVSLGIVRGQTNPTFNGNATITGNATSYVGTGTLSSSGQTVTGSGTAFTSQLKVGDVIVASGQAKTVTGIISDTSLKVNGSFDPPLSGASFTYTEPSGRILAGANQDGLVIQATSSTAYGLLQITGSTGISLFNVNANGQVYADGLIQSTNGTFRSYSSAAVFQSGDLNSGFDSNTATLRSGNGTNASSGNVYLQSGTASSAGKVSGNIVIDNGSVSGGATAGSISIGVTTASAVSIGRTGVATTVNGTLTVTEATTISGTLTVTLATTLNNTLTVNGHIISGNTSGGTTTVAAGAAACTTPTVGITGNDTSGTVTITTGTSCAAPGELATVTFANAYDTAPRIVLTPANAASAALQYYRGSTTTNFTINTGTNPVDSTAYEYDYQIIQ